MIHSLALTICFLISTATVAQKTELEPAEVVSKSKAAYQTCQSYTDTGFITAWVMLDSSTSREDYSFATAMKKDAGFRFEFSMPRVPQSNFVVWGNKAEAHLWNGVRQQKSPEETVFAGIVKTAGISHGLSTCVPPLLLGYKEINGVFDLTELKRVKDAYMNGQPCIVLTGKTRKAKRTVWIDQTTYLIRSVEEQSNSGDYRTLISYFPEINQEVDANSLGFEGTN